MSTETLIMKDSKIDWIGKIASDWQIERIKYFTNLNGRIGWQGLTTEDYKDEGPYLITGVDFLNGSIDWDSCTHITEKRWIEANTIQIKNGDLLITKDGTVGKVAIVSDLIGKASLNSGVLLVRPQENTEYYNRYIYYQLLSDVFWAWFEFNKSGNSTIIHLYQQDFSNLYVLLPNIKEQQAIADFLDEKCKKIDKVVNKIGEQIQILEEYKKSLITEAVTKGLNKNAPMKDSGIDWIGKIPKEWEIKRLKYIGTARNGLTYEPEDMVDEDGTLVLRSSNIQNDKLSFKDNVYVKMKIPKQLIIKENDLLICSRNGSRNLIGKCALIDDKTAGQSYGAFMCVFRSKYNRFIRYVLLSDIFNYYLSNFLTATINQLTNMQLANIKTPIPPIKDMEKIVDYLDKECEKIDKTINNKKEQLETIKEYKKSLIYEYVTGKKRVAC